MLIVGNKIKKFSRDKRLGLLQQMLDGICVLGVVDINVFQVVLIKADCKILVVSPSNFSPY